jgi:hypothetical protein
MTVNSRPISVSTTVDSGAVSTDVDGGGGSGGVAVAVANESPAPPPRPVLVTTVAGGSLAEEPCSQWQHRPSRFSRTSRTSRWTITAREDSAAGYYYDQMNNPPTGEGEGALGNYENLGGYVDIGGDYTGAAPQLVVRNTALKSEAQVSHHRPASSSTPHLVKDALQLAIRRTNRHSRVNPNLKLSNPSHITHLLKGAGISRGGGVDRVRVYIWWPGLLHRRQN